MVLDFGNQIAVVTGASRGIGKDIALAFGAAGATVACVATTEKGAEATAELIREAGGLAKGYACNVADASSVQALFDAVVANHGTPAVLINNAGITKDTLMLRMSDEDWNQVLAVNLTGTFNCCRAATKLMMKARYGRIVNITSVIGIHGGAGQANYAASKAGVIGLTMTVAREFGSRGITCNAVAPGYVETDMTSGLPEAMKAKVVESAPLGRLGQASDLVGPVLFLASAQAGYITGQTLTVDGGLTL